MVSQSSEQPGVAPQALTMIDGELRVAHASACIMRFTLPEPIDARMTPADTYRLDLCLTPRPLDTRGCFVEHWGPHRFEPLGDVFLVPPGQLLHTRGHGGEQVSVTCDLSRTLVDPWLDTDLEWTDRRLEAALDMPSPHVRSLLNRLAEECRRPGLGGNALVELIAGQLAIEIGRFCESIGDGPSTGGLAAWRLRLIDERLRDSAVPPRLDELSRSCSLSVRQLTRGFRASRGCSISDYVERSRIESAKRLLAQEGSVKSIAFATGFASPSSFAYAFRRATGSSPRQFRSRVHRPRD
jgi:AraC family transcriptional regulator